MDSDTFESTQNPHLFFLNILQNTDSLHDTNICLNSCRGRNSRKTLLKKTLLRHFQSETGRTLRPL